MTIPDHFTIRGITLKRPQIGAVSRWLLPAGLILGLMIAGGRAQEAPQPSTALPVSAASPAGQPLLPPGAGPDLPVDLTDRPSLIAMPAAPDRPTASDTGIRADAGPPVPAPAPATTLPIDTSISALIIAAHPVVQAVMALLTAAVFAVLTVFIFKLVEFALAFARLSRAMRALQARPGLAPLDGNCPLARTVAAALAEATRLPPQLTPALRAAACERLDLMLERIEAGAVRQLGSGTGMLASIGAVAPFVGLFGTVFGIMNSFLAITASQTTNLAVVAPGIAEALLATGIGLVAAIPAVLLHNRTTRRIIAYRHRLADGTAEVLRRFSHALDKRMVAGA